MKRIWVLVLAAAMLWMAGACAAGSGTGPANTADIELDGSIIASGSCGANAQWALTSQDTLTIWGSGPMDAYVVNSSGNNAPWYENYRDNYDGQEHYVKRAEIRDGITSIGSYAFYGCSQMESVEIPESVQSVGTCAFAGCSYLKAAALPEGITEIAPYTFSRCSALAEVTIPGSAESIGERAFAECGPLSITWGEESRLGTIGEGAFYSCSMEEILLPEGVESIGLGAFQGCMNLRTAVIPEGTGTISVSLFEDCTMLTTVSIPKSVTTIRTGAFNNCQGLSFILYTGTEAEWDAITIEDNNTALTGKDIHYSYDPENPVALISGECGKEETDTVTYTLNERGVLTISGSGRMADYKDYGDNNRPPWIDRTDMIRSVVVEEGVTRIGNSAFSGAWKLREVSLPDSLTEIGDDAFRSCSGITGVTFPRNLQSIGNYAFDACFGLKHIILQEGIASIGYNAFYETYALKDVYYTGTQDEWGDISIGTRNFQDAAIHYDFGFEITGMPEELTVHMLPADYTGTELQFFGAEEGSAWIEQYTIVSGMQQDAVHWSLTRLTEEEAPDVTMTEIIDAAADRAICSLHEESIPETPGDVQMRLSAQCGSLTDSVDFTIHYEVISDLSEFAEAWIYPETDHVAEGTELLIEGGLPHAHAQDASGPKLEITEFSGDESQLTLSAGEGETELYAAFSQRGIYTLTMKLIYKNIAWTQTVTVGVGASLNEVTEWPDENRVLMFPAYLTEIGNEALENTAAEAAIIPYGCRKIGPKAFNGCRELKIVDIPSSVKQIDWTAFEGCDQLVYIITHAPETTLLVLEHGQGLIPVIGEDDEGGNG